MVVGIYDTLNIVFAQGGILKKFSTCCRHRVNNTQPIVQFRPFRPQIVRIGRIWCAHQALLGPFGARSARLLAHQTVSETGRAKPRQRHDKSRLLHIWRGVSRFLRQANLLSQALPWHSRTACMAPRRSLNHPSVSRQHRIPRALPPARRFPDIRENTRAPQGQALRRAPLMALRLRPFPRYQALRPAARRQP